MVLGVALMLWGFVIARRKGKGWMKLHHKVMTAAAVSSAIGLGTGIYMVAVGSGVHLRLPHSWIGAVTLVMALVTLSLGLGYLKAKGPRKKKLRTPKIWMGRVTVTLMVATTAMGVLTVLFGL